MTQTTKQTDYQKQAADFLEQTQTSFFVKYLKSGKYFEDDKEERDIYEIELLKGGRKYKFNFGQSINCSGEFQLLDARLRAKFGRSFASSREIEKLRLPIFEKKAAIRKNNNYSIPTPYDVLACLQKYDPGTFEDFCSEFGYDTDSRKSEKIYKAVVNEWQNVAMLFTDKEIEQLQEIQ